MTAWPAISTAAALYLDKFIAGIFAAGARGVWHDLSDKRTRFQDASGNTPVTGSEQSLGLLLDKSEFLRVSSADILEGNGGFDDPSYWPDVNGVSTFLNGKLVFNADTLGGKWNGQNTSGRLTVGRYYQCEFNIDSITSGGVTIWAGFSSSSSKTTVGPQVARLLCTNDDSVRFYSDGTLTQATVDDLKIYAIAGHQTSQTTATARPRFKTGPDRMVPDGLDDVLETHFTDGPLGDECTIVRSVPGVGAVIEINQSIANVYAWDTELCGLIVIDRSLSAFETAILTRWATLKAFA